MAGSPARGRFRSCSSFDHVGPLARSVGDLALAYDAMQGPDADDAACTTRPVEPALPSLAQDIGDLRIAVAGGYFQNNVFPEATEAVGRVAKALGASARRSKFRKPRVPAPPLTSSPLVKALRCISIGCARAPDDFDPAVRDRLIAGAMIPAPLVDRAQKFRRWYRAQVLELFKSVDVILAPATPCVAPKLGQMNFVLDGVELTGARQYRHSHPADLLYRLAGGRRSGSARADADRRADHRRAVA